MPTFCKDVKVGHLILDEVEINAENPRGFKE